jgi:hypothetical protein
MYVEYRRWKQKSLRDSAPSGGSDSDGQEVELMEGRQKADGGQTDGSRSEFGDV